MHREYTIAFFGSSLVSCYWNGAATYYRGILRSLHRKGHRITFYEPDAYDRQNHRDIAAPDYARSVVYRAEENELRRMLDDAKTAVIVIKASGIGVCDELLEHEILGLQKNGTRVIFWDVDAPATLDRVHADDHDRFRPLIPRYDLILLYGGGDPVVNDYQALGAKRCVPIYNALDPDTHFSVPADPSFKADLGFLGNRMPDREERVHEFFFKAATLSPRKKFILGGNGWHENAPDLPNVTRLGHMGTGMHNTFNSSLHTVLNINRESMARYGFSPPTRIFEAAGAGACIITDAWKGIELFLEPGFECITAVNGAEVASILNSLSPEQARRIGSRACWRILSEHTYRHRAEQFEQVVNS
jgi:spore maturation protein CgeB